MKAGIGEELRTRLGAALMLVIFASVSIQPTVQVSADDSPTGGKTAQQRLPVSVQKPQKTSNAGLPRRVPWTTSHVIGSPEPPHPYQLERAFPSTSSTTPSTSCRSRGLIGCLSWSIRKR